MIIGVFTDTYAPDINGVATACRTLHDIFVSHGHRVIVITTGLPRQREVTFQDDILRIPGMTLKFLYGYRMAFFFNKKAYRILKKIPFDVFHIQQEFGISLFGRLCGKKLHIPMVYTYHTSYEDYSNYLSHGAKVTDHLTKKAIRSVTRFVIPPKCEIVTPSLKSRKKLRLSGVSQYINVIPNALDFSEFQIKQDPIKEENFRKEHQLTGKRILLSLGRLAFEKNIKELIDGFTAYKIKYQDEDTVLMIVGDGPEEKKLKAEAEASPVRKDIFFIPAVPHEETGFFYRMCDAFLCASTSETQGLTYSEAIASGALILVKYDFNLEPMIQDGKTGFYYDSINILPDQIHKVLTLDSEIRIEIIDSAKAKNDELYSEASFYERMLHVYRKTIRHSF